MKVIRNLNIRKSCQTTDIPTKVIKLNSDILEKLIYKCFNYYIDRGDIPDELKHVKFVPVDVRNSRVTKWSYEIKLRKMTSHFKLLTRKFL